MDRCFGIATLGRVKLFQNESSGVAVLSSDWSHIDVEKKERVEFEKNVVLTQDFSKIISTLPVSLKQNVNSTWVVEHHNLRLKALCTECKDEKNKGTYITIWNQENRLKTIKIPSDATNDKKSNGDEINLRVGKVIPYKFNSECPFASAQWSPDGTKLLFMVECNIEDKKEDYHWKHKWGESITEIKNPTICVLNIETEKFSLLDNETLKSLNICCGQATWAPDSQSIVFVGHALTPYRLGLVYCLQRPARLYKWNTQSNVVVGISSTRHAVRSPRFSPNGEHLVWLDMFIGGPHLQCQRLLLASWSQIQALKPDDDLCHVKELIPLVDYPDSNSRNFPGVFCPSGLPTNCWSNNSRFLCFSTYWGFSSLPIAVDVETVLRQYPRDNLQQVSLTCPLLLPQVFAENVPQDVAILEVTDTNAVIARASMCGVQNMIAVLKLDENVESKKWSLISIDSDEVLKSPVNPKHVGMQNIEHKVFKHQAKCDEKDPFKVTSFDSWLFYPTQEFSGKDDGKVCQIPIKKLKGLVLIIHGGPHSAFISRWYPSVASFISQGYGCLAINYRGSIGYGDAVVHCLLGKIGHYDVDDCVQATDEGKKFLEDRGFKNLPIFLYGGSHGGFLTCHLAAKYGLSKFRAAVARNPVTDLTSMALSTDIPDWVLVEAGLEQLEFSRGTTETASPAPRGQLWYMGQIPRGAEMLDKLSRASPMTYVDEKWDIPLYMFLGAKDQRVPMFQGETFYKRVLACTAKSNVACEAFLYPDDGHALDSVAAQIDGAIQILKIFDQHSN